MDATEQARLRAWYNDLRPWFELACLKYPGGKVKIAIVNVDATFGTREVVREFDCARFLDDLGVSAGVLTRGGS